MRSTGARTAAVSASGGGKAVPLMMGATGVTWRRSGRRESMGGILCNPPRACLGEGDHAKHGGGGREMLRDVAPKPESRTVTRSRRLRRVMSPPEIALWQVLRARLAGLKFRRQHTSGDRTEERSVGKEWGKKGRIG